MAEKRDYYEVLGLSKDASKDDIRRAYRKLAKKYHPDVNKAADAEEKFKEVQEAYDILSDDTKKAQYDQFGFAAFDQNGGGYSQDFSGFGFEDIFDSFFGGGTSSRSRRSTGPAKGEDRFMQLNIDFMDAIKGKKQDISVSYDETCSQCNGTGAKSPGDITTCPKCNGTGSVRTQQRSPFGTYISESVCPDCNGTGKKIKVICPNCRGKGYKNKTTKVELNIPAGINTHQQLRVPGKGYRGTNGGPNGDLYVEINVKSHRHFKREGQNIYINVPISSVDATLGCEVDVPTVYGDVTMKIPEGTQSGTTLRLKGKGVKSLRGDNYGDQFVTIEVKIPTKLNKEERDLYERLRKAKKESIFDQFKKNFRK